jgi:hypothetical protein
MMHQRRQFVRDGDVPVTVIHRQTGHDIAYELDKAKQALIDQATAHEDAERALADARTRIHDLETKLGHERLAQEEATQRASTEKRQLEAELMAAQEELASERARRARAERQHDKATIAQEAAEKRLRQLVVTAPPKQALSTPPRLRGRPPKIAPDGSRPDESETVEWWVPGWRKKYR